MSAKPQLLYFAVPGRGEIVRLLYHHAGAEFEEKNVTFEEFPALKKNAEEMPLGFIPVLKTPCGKKLSQTAAIIRYIAGELNLFGKSSVERAILDITIVSNKELADAGFEITYATKEESDKVTKRESLEKKINVFFPYFEKLIKESEGPFINGKEISVADIYFYDTMNVVKVAMPDKKYLEKYQLLQNVYTKVTESANLKKYLASKST